MTLEAEKIEKLGVKMKCWGSLIYKVGVNSLPYFQGEGSQLFVFSVTYN